MRARLDYLQKDFRRFWVLPQKVEFIPTPATDIYVDASVATQPQTKFRFGRWAHTSLAVAAHALVFGAVWFITSILCSNSSSVK